MGSLLRRLLRSLALAVEPSGDTAWEFERSMVMVVGMGARAQTASWPRSSPAAKFKTRSLGTILDGVSRAGVILRE